MAIQRIYVPNFSIFAMDSATPQPYESWLVRKFIGKICTWGNETLQCMPIDGSQSVDPTTFKAILFQIFITFDSTIARDNWIAGTPAIGDDIIPGWVDLDTVAMNQFPLADYTIDLRSHADDLATGLTASARVIVPKLDTVGIGLAEDDCFAVGIGTDMVSLFTYSNNCFRFVVPDFVNCYVSRIQYWGNENQFGFDYCTGFMNDILMPFYISRPQFSETRRVFSKSNGEEQLVSAVIKKSYELRTDYLNEHQHEVLNMALSHDNVYLIDIRILQEGGLPSRRVVKSEDYSIAWHETVDTERAPARARVTLTPYEAINSNCEACEVFCSIDVSSNEAHWIEVGDINFYSESVQTIYLEEKITITAPSCGDDGYQINVYDSINPNITSIVPDGFGGFTITMDTLASDTYLADQLLFNARISCVDPELATECEAIVGVYGTISFHPCPAPVFGMSSFALAVQVQWNGPPTFMPEPDNGYTIQFYNTSSHPFPGNSYDYETGSMSPYIHLESTAVYNPGPLTVRLTAHCIGIDEAFYEDEYEVPDFGYIVVYACYGAAEVNACGCGSAFPVYIDSADVALGIGVNVYLNTGLTIPVSDGFISEGTSGKSIFVISGGAGLITSDTGNDCL